MPKDRDVKILDSSDLDQSMLAALKVRAVLLCAVMSNRHTVWLYLFDVYAGRFRFQLVNSRV